MRLRSGQMSGRLYVYSALNADAARAFRKQEWEAAHQLAHCATALERSHEAAAIQAAISRLSAAMPADPLGNDAPGDLRRYISLKRRYHWQGQDSRRLARQWLTLSQAWLGDPGEDNVLTEAVETLSNRAEEARLEILGEEQRAVTTFFGVLVRMNPSFAEIESPQGEVMVVQREELEREGLAVLGAGVAVLHEALPEGGSYTLPKPAALLEPPTPIENQPPPLDPDFAGMGGFQAAEISARDAQWLERELSREPTILAPTPLRMD